MMPHQVDVVVAVEAGGWEETLPDAEALCLRAAEAALSAAAQLPDGVPRGPAELSVVLADDGMVRDLNLRYRGKDKSTNVLSFALHADSGDEILESPHADGDEGTEIVSQERRAPILLGDVILAFETVDREAREQGKPFPDHLAHLVIHGVLHLLGFDHIADPDAERMERLETEILAGLGIADPYAGRDGEARAPDDPHRVRDRA